MGETRVISVTNHKGGVGKTTSVASIGAALALKGYKTLLIDLDAQANLTASLLQEEEQERTVYHALRERKGLPVVRVRNNLSLAPSSLDLAGVEIEISAAIHREFILRDVIEPVKGGYDFILLDCPPSLGLITINALAASTDVIVPLTAEALPFKGLTMLQKVLDMAKGMLNPSLSLSGIILSRWEGRKLNRLVEEALRASFGDKVFDTKIRTNVAIAEAPLSKTDILSYGAESNGAKDYLALTGEMLRRMGRPENAANI